MADEDFEFNPNAPIWRIPKNAMLLSLQVFVREREPKNLTTLAYDAWPRKICTAETISKRFGGWRAALGRVGVKSGIRARKYSPEVLMDNLERVWRELGQRPGKRQLCKYGERISETPYINRWGSVRNACQLLAQYKQGHITQEQLLGRTSKARRRTVPLNTRWDILKRDNYMCTRCGERPPEVRLEIDHIVPVAQGGSNAFENLRVLCSRCNQGKRASAD